MVAQVVGGLEDLEALGGELESVPLAPSRSVSSSIFRPRPVTMPT
jgi:hypothetical protein